MDKNGMVDEHTPELDLPHDQVKQADKKPLFDPVQRANRTDREIAARAQASMPKKPPVS